MPELKRYLSPDKFKKFLDDFNFLFKKIKKSFGELDLKLRNNYFNLYYKGNSLSKVSFEGKKYKATINHKFDENVFEEDKRFSDLTPERNYATYLLMPEQLEPFFQTKYLKRIYSNIKKVNYGEEITFEQMLITDNLERQEFFIIDRQITETSLKKRLDLLALEQVKHDENKYHFLVIEVKLGNNPELKKDVGDQLDSYVTHINENFANWKRCYEENYKQIKKTGIFDIPKFSEIEIINNTQGRVVVGGYSGIGKKNIEKLKSEYTDIIVEPKWNRL